MTSHLVTGLSLDQKLTLLRRAQDICFEWWIDILDCNKSFTRQRIDMPFDEILSKLDESSHFTVIRRNDPGRDYIEVGFRTSGSGPDYFCGSW